MLHEARYRDVWFTYLLTGLRASELAELPTDSVKLDTPAPHLVVVGKGSKERIVPIHGHDAVSHFRKLVADARVRRDSRLMPWRTRRVQGLWQQDRERLGLPEDITIHTFRHTYGTFMAYRDLVGTQRAMGHSDIKTTMLYVHDDDRLIRESSVQWGAVLHGDEARNGTKSVPHSKNPK